MSANEHQVGGSHYAGKYQHWDWVADIKLPYHPACASKYVYRCRLKNGDEDLQKAAHYLEKSIELGIVYEPRAAYWDNFWNLIASAPLGIPLNDARVLFAIQQGRWAYALEGIKLLLNQSAVGDRTSTTPLG